MQVFLHMIAFSLQSDGSGRPVLTKESALRQERKTLGL